MTREFVTLELGTESWTFRALDLEQLEELEEDFVRVSVGLSSPDGRIPKEALQGVANIAMASLKFKHPSIAREQVRKLVTLGTLSAVMEAVRGVSGLDQPGEPPAGGV